MIDIESYRLLMIPEILWDKLLLTIVFPKFSWAKPGMLVFGYFDCETLKNTPDAKSHKISYLKSIKSGLNPFNHSSQQTIFFSAAGKFIIIPN